MRNRRWESYDDYLRSPEWAHIRQMVIDRAKGRCQVCNSDNSLQVHHRVYDAAWGNESTDDLVCLCHSCHMVFHKNEGKIKHINQLEKKLANLKKAEAERGRKRKIKDNPDLKKTIYLSGPVRKFTPEELAVYNLKGDINAPLKK